MSARKAIQLNGEELTKSSLLSLPHLSDDNLSLLRADFARRNVLKR